MSVPLATGYREEPLWWAGIEWDKPARGDLPGEVDVVVVGGGFTGLTAARELTQGGRSTLVLEKGRIGSGASSRNSGMVHPGFKVSPSTLVARYGDQGRALYRISLEAFELVARTIRDEQIECRYRQTGHLEVSDRAEHAGQFAREADLYRVANNDGSRVLQGDQLLEEVGSARFKVGLLVERSGALDPTRYLLGLLRAARSAGAAIYDETEALSLKRAGKKFEVTTTRGSVWAAEVLIATEGYTGSLVRAMQARVLPVGSYMIATEPLRSDVANRLIRNGRMMFDSRNFLHYWRLSYDSRLLFGGRASFAPTTIERARSWLYRSMLEIYPELEGVGITNAWGGRLGFARDFLPHVGQMDGITYALGYCGTGVALSGFCGMLAAKVILGEELPRGLQRPFPPLALGKRTQWLLPLVGLYYQARDALGLY